MQWTVKINGIDQISVQPGERVEIGRRPLRPLADDGNVRVDVIDSTKSMSKRHALLEVNQGGGASIRDLDSTNGTYVVRDNGDLLRLPAGVDFLLPTSPMRMQFGDVPVDLIRVEQPVDEPQQTPVPDLFGFAVDAAKTEPDAADMSVDDILDLRAGEPTSMFHATAARQQIDELDLSNPLTQLDPEPVEPRDLFADAVADATTGGDAPAGDDADTSTVEHAGEPAFERETEAQAPAADTSAVTAAASAEPSASVASVASEPVTSVASVESIGGVEPVGTADATGAVESIESSDAMQTGPEDGIAASTYAGMVFTPMEQSSATVAATQPTTMESGTGTDATAAFTPAFEPGSVFDRVSKGEMQEQEPSIEVDGLTSDEARRTDDFSVQFEMARHPELLPFLAMNPSLYDDLYAWLSAQGDHDIDEALAHNQGYQDYREAVGK